MPKRGVLAAATAALALFGAGAAPAAAEPTPLTGSGSTRIYGADRYATAVAVSKKTFTTPQETVFVASGENYPDALAAGPAAAAFGAPVLLVKKNSIPSGVAAEIQRLSPEYLVVVGGTGAISNTVASQLGGYANDWDRVSGSDRYATAGALADAFEQADVVYLASGETYADALAGGAAAAAEGAPLLLTGRSSLPAATKADLTRLKPQEVVVLGGTGAITNTVASAAKSASGGTITRFAGVDRYETAAQLAAAVWSSGAQKVFYAPGTSFPDALAGTPAAYVNDAPILLTSGSCMPFDTAAVTGEFLNPSLRVFLGGAPVSYAGTKGCGPAPTYPFPADLDCADFSSRAAAQAWFTYWYPRIGDLYRLDGDDDGLVCERM